MTQATHQADPQTAASKANSFSKEELVACGEGKLFGPGNAQLPVDNMLMLDRITNIQNDLGAFNKGFLHAELDINPDLWFFQCHFIGDPVMPGCLGLDAMWQLVGFYLGWIGNPGKGRALGVGNVKFTGEVLQDVKLVRYEIDMKKIMSPGGTTVGLANGLVLADDKKFNRLFSLQYCSTSSLLTFLSFSRSDLLPIRVIRQSSWPLDCISFTHDFALLKL